MSAYQANALNLNNLPEDIIRKIIAIRIDSIDDLKLVAPRWNVLARELLENRSRLPMIKRLNYVSKPGEDFGIGIVFPSAYRKYFGMLNRRKTKNSANLRTFVEVSEDSFEFSVDTEQLMHGVETDIDFLRPVFERCSSVELLHMEMNFAVGGMYIRPIKRVTGPLKIDELRLTGRCLTCYAEEIAEFVKENDVRLISLMIFDIQFVKESGKFFIEIESGKFFIETSAVSIIKFVDLVPFGTDGEKAKVRAAWNEATDWLNETGKITAKLEAGYYIDGYYNAKMCITVERKTGI